MSVRTKLWWAAVAGTVVVSGGCADAVTNVSPAPAPYAAVLPAGLAKRLAVSGKADIGCTFTVVEAPASSP